MSTLSFPTRISHTHYEKTKEKKITCNKMKQLPPYIDARNADSSTHRPHSACLTLELRRAPRAGMGQA